jgi:Crp-like helix-turn-helix domain
LGHVQASPEQSCNYPAPPRGYRVLSFYIVADQSQAIRDLIVRYNDFLLAQIQQSVACNALHAVEERLCRWLLQADDCAEGHTVPLTQEFLGQMLGVRRTTVTLAARQLQARGLIRYRRGHIQILDRAALEHMSNADKMFPAPPCRPKRDPLHSQWELAEAGQFGFTMRAALRHGKTLPFEQWRDPF